MNLYNIRGTYHNGEFKIITNYEKEGSEHSSDLLRLKVPQHLLVNEIENITDSRKIQRGIKCNTLGGPVKLSNIMWNLNIQIPIIHQSLYEALYYFIFVKPYIFYSSNPNKISYVYNNLISKTKDQMCQLIQQHLINHNLIV
jgi:hypothetical protein